jgi:nuclear pore complex protein Nup98-Nup96
MFQSSWGNQGQQQQQNPQNAFGTPSAFGSNTGTSSECTVLRRNHLINYFFSLWASWFWAATAAAAAATSSEPHVWKYLRSPFNGAFGRFWYVSINPIQFPLSFLFEGAFANSGTGAFGQNKPSTGFSAFSGGTGAFGGTSNTFGQPSNPSNTGTSIFGQPSTSNASTGFGGTNAFGANKPTTSVFGSTSTGV